MPDFASALLVGTVLDEAEAASKDVLLQAFDRLDISLLKASGQLVRIHGELRRQLGAQMNMALGEIEEGPGRIIGELKYLVDEIGEAVSSGLTGKIQGFVCRFVRANPGFMHLPPSVVKAGDRSAIFRIQGTSLDNVELTDMRLDGAGVVPEILWRAADEILFRLPLDADALRLRRMGNESGLLHLPLSFTIVETPLPCQMRLNPPRPCQTALFVFPEIIARVVAVFSGEGAVQEAGFVYRHQGAGLNGPDLDYHNHAADHGRLSDFNLAHPGPGTDSRYSVLHSSAEANTRNPGQPALHLHPPEMTGAIAVNKFPAEGVNQYFETRPAPLHIGQDLHLRIPGEVQFAEGLRLSHVEIRSPLLKGGEVILSPGGEGDGRPDWGGFSLRCSEDGKTALVSARFI